MTTTTRSSRGPNLDEILVRLSELAPLDDSGELRVESTTAPIPESSSARSRPVLDLTEIAARTEQLVPATIESPPATDIVATAPTLERPITESPVLEKEATEPTIDYAPATDVPATTDDSAIIDLRDADNPVIETVQRVTDEKTSEMPVAAATTTASPPVEPIDIRPERIEPTEDPSVRRPQVMQPARRHNPFRRLIVWSIVLGLGLLIVVAVMLAL